MVDNESWCRAPGTVRAPRGCNRPLKLNADSLPAQLAQRLLSAYLISGDEPLLAGEAADAVRARARAAGFSEREVHFIERAADWDGVRAAAGNL